MGLVFAMVFRRSANLWIIAVMHAFGNSYIISAFGTVR
jgi:membrane protease YdiL (CAAX protease family)